MSKKLKQNIWSIVAYSLLLTLLISSCSQKSENITSLPGCSVKFSNEQILDIAQEYLKTNYPNQIIKEVKLTGCESGESTFIASVYENNIEIAILHISGNSGKATYFKR